MKIILATDGTKHGEAAVEMLGKFGLGEGDAVRIVNVVDMALPLSMDVYGGFLPDTEVLEDAARESAEKVVSQTTEKVTAFFEGKGVAIDSDILFGSPDSRIVETSEEFGADLILIGSHGHSRWERLLLGSVSSSVVSHAHCSVLVVRIPAE